MIFTFYSFKGGVGRSMMLANAAEHFYRRGLDVLMVDFDLEAPGLERFFSKPAQDGQSKSVATAGPSLPDHATLVESRGVMDLLVSYKTLQALPPPQPEQPSSPASDGAGSSAAPPRFPFHVEPLDNFIVPIFSGGNSGEGTLSLMPAGRRDGNEEYALYAERVRTFNWDDFYVQYHGAQFFNWFGEQLSKKYDVVLIDSRTGITEMSGVCTHELADAVVLFVAANEQNLEGTARIANSLSRKDLIASRGGRSLSILIVPSRVELAEGEKLNKFSTQYSVLAKLIDDRIKFSADAFHALRVPYIPFYAFGERVAVREPELQIAADMIAAAARICTAMFELVPKDSPAYIQYQAAHANLASLDDEASFAEPPVDFAGRDWVFEAIESWFEHPSPTLLIVGPPGSGKTTIAARLVAAAKTRTALPRALRSAGSLTMAHSCQMDDGWRPFLSTIARKLATRWPAYTAAALSSAAAVPGISIGVQQRISGIQDQAAGSSLSLESVSIAGDVSPEMAFRVLVQQPLQHVGRGDAPTPPALILIDGLDEVLSSDKETLADVLAAGAKLGWPTQLKLLILSRPDSRILRLSPNVIELDGDPEAGKRDIAAYVDLRLAKRLGPDSLPIVAEQIANAASGNFLYASLVLDAVQANGEDASAVVANVDKFLKTDQIPQELHKHYAAMVQQEVGFNTERWSEWYRPVLGVLAVAAEGFTADELAGILGWLRSEISDGLRLMQKLVVESSDTRQFRLFHPSFAAFLLTDTEYGVSAVEAYEQIANYFVGQYAGQWNTAPTLAVRHTDYYFIRAINEATDRRKGRELTDRLAELVLDPTFIEAKVAGDAARQLQLGIGTIAKNLESVGRPLPEELRRLGVLLLDPNRDLLARIQKDRGWLRARLAGHPEEIATSDPAPPPGEKSPEASEPMPDPQTPKPEDLVTDEMLRRRIPTAVRIELSVAHRALMTGKIVLLVAVLLTGLLLASRYLPTYLTDDLLYGVYAIVVLGGAYLSSVAWQDRLRALRIERLPPPPPFPSSAPPASSDESPADWEALPEIIELRAQRAPYPLLGGVSAASPYFEIALVVFLIGAVVGAVSYPLHLIRFLPRVM